MPKDDLLKVTIKSNDAQKTQSTMSIDDILNQSKDINLILDKLDEHKQKQMEEEIKKIEVFFNIFILIN